MLPAWGSDLEILSQIPIGDRTVTEELDAIQREYWRNRASSIKDLELKSIADPTQRVGEMRFILERIPSGSRVLEIGCGSGYMTSKLAETASELVCIDIQEEMINASRLMVPENLHSKVKWVCQSFHDFKDEQKFDVIVSSRVFINFPSRQLQITGLDCLKSNLKEKGMLFFLEGEESAFGHLNNSREKLGLTRIQTSPINLYLDKEFFDTLGKIGFQLEDRFDNGLYDAITRILVPALDTAEDLKSKQNLSFEWIESIDWADLSKYSRVAGGLYKLINAAS